MIISKKKLNEKIREALDREERERWMHEKIDRVERECNERINGVLNYCSDLERKLSTLLEEKRLG